jgi:hypothetical protein
MRQVSWIALSLVLVFTFGLAAQDVGAPKLQAPEVNFDFGYIPQVSKVGHPFALHNVGNGELKILKVKPSCGCTQAPLEKDLVGPGDSTSVEIIFTSKSNYRGVMNKSAAVTTNDDTYGTLRLRFSATINENPDSVGPVQLTPWDIKYNPTERSETMTVEVKNVSDKPLDLQMVSFPHKYLDIDFPAGALAPGKTETIGVKIRGDVSDQAFEKSFTFATGDEANTRFTIPVVLMPSLTQMEHQ